MRESIRDGFIAVGFVIFSISFPVLLVYIIRRDAHKVKKVLKKEIVITIIKGDTTLKNFNKQ